MRLPVDELEAERDARLYLRIAAVLAVVSVVLMVGSLAIGLRAAEGASLRYPRHKPVAAMSLHELERFQVRVLSHYRGALRVHNRVAGRRALSRVERSHRRWYQAATGWTSRELAETRGRVRARQVRARQASWGSWAFPDPCLREISRRETAGTYSPTIWNYQGSGAYGIGQALPASKMRPFGADYMTNPWTQLRWLISYVNGRYGGSCAALAFHNRTGWY